ncbi:MAG: uroporphyrinogen decarboxylase family protein [Bacillota bacterium]
MRQPDFKNLLKVLRRERPDRPTLFEFFLNMKLEYMLAGEEIPKPWDDYKYLQTKIVAFKNAGYDYNTIQGSNFHFPKPEHRQKKSISLNERSIIHDRESFETYTWPDPDDFDYSRLDQLSLPEGMKFIVWGPSGVLENVIELTGYDNLCFMIYEQPELAGDIFDAVGSRLLKYYEICAPFEKVGALISNDDWGFNQQTMLSPADMRKYVFPWHKRIVEAIHRAGKPAILHSCGNLESVFDDIIDDMKYDAKHSYEDKIMPVEKAYEKWGSRIAILGGIDVSFICLSTPEEVAKRSRAMLERTADRGGYALGTGNSVPEYVPAENYLAMIKTAL